MYLKEATAPVMNRTEQDGKRDAISMRALFLVGAAVCSIALVAIAISHQSSPSAPAARAVVHRVAVSASAPARRSELVDVVITPKTLIKPFKLSAFDLEQAMSYAQRMKRWDPLIKEAAQRFDVPQPWLRAVMQIESGGRTMASETQPIISTAGAMGLMQLMPSTYADMRAEYRLGIDPYNPHDNVIAGAAYLHFLRGKYGYPMMFAAYNDGPGNLEARLVQGGLLPAETVHYVGFVTGKVDGGVSGAHGSVKFTRPNGEAVYIDGASVLAVRAALPGEYAPGVQTVIKVGRIQQGVLEGLGQTRSIIRAHGGAV